MAGGTGNNSCIGSVSGMTRTDGSVGRRRWEGGNRGPGPELEYSSGTDSRPHRGSKEGWREVVGCGDTPPPGEQGGSSGGGD